MKEVITIIFFLFAFQIIGVTQNSNKLDSLKNVLSHTIQDSSRASIMNKISGDYRVNRPDSAIFYANKALLLARKINSPELKIFAMTNIALAQLHLGNESGALQVILEAIKIAEKNSLLEKKPGLFMLLGWIYDLSGDYLKALNLFRRAKSIADSNENIYFIVLAPSRMAQAFLKLNQLDSALYYGQLANKNAQKFNMIEATALGTLGQFYLKKGNIKLALKYFQESLFFEENATGTINKHYQIAQVYQEMGIVDSSVYYANKSLTISLENEIYSSIIKSCILLSDIYENKDPAKALQYSKSAISYRDSLDQIRKNTTLAAFTEFDEQERQYEIETATATYKNKVQRLWIFSIAGALLSALFVAIILFRNNKNKQKANAKLKGQKEQIKIQKDKAETALAELKATQSQLIQSEKMASLGELTAGIAHEIQNPLNFVNNFSEVSNELIDEMNEELDNGDINEAKTISRDIKQNLEKINHHGKRAEAIVKGMLQHSQTSSGQKEPTDINKLADEYLRLSYHGLRAKDKSFNAKMNTDFDENIGQISIVPQDIGRVILNLINNAFYVVDEKKKSGIENYEPTVSVDTKKANDKIEIKVRDNGNGIPQKVLDKIFQPFFTTKPTGQGTGLGLSLSYDIVKAHGGEISLDSILNEGTAFTITLPIQL